MAIFYSLLVLSTSTTIIVLYLLYYEVTSPISRHLTPLCINFAIQNRHQR